MKKLGYSLFIPFLVLLLTVNDMTVHAVEDTTRMQLDYSGLLAEDGTVIGLDSSLDRNGDGIVTAYDVDYIIFNPNSELMTDIKHEEDGTTEVKLIVYRALNEKLGLGISEEELARYVSGESVFWIFDFELDVQKYLENYDYIACLYAMCDPSFQINSFWSKGMDGCCIEDGFLVAMNYSIDNFSGVINNLSGTSFPRDVDEADGNWSGNTGNPITNPTPAPEDDEFLVQHDASDWLNNIVGGGVTDEGVALPDGSDLTYGEKKQLGIWLTSIELSKNYKWYESMRVVRIIIGILCIVYSVLLFLCYWLDKVNTIFDISLLGLISFGRFVASAEDNVSTYKGKSKEPKLLTFKDVLIVSGGILLLGFLILTGTLYVIVVSVINKVNQFLGGL